MVEISSGKPYEDLTITENEWIRIFDPKADSEEYVWHRDRNDREVTILFGDGWGFQYDNEMPIAINRHDELFIGQMTYHRLIRGTTPLILLIKERTNVQQH
jgi:hypothetical protein